MANIDDLFKESLKKLRNTRTLVLTSELLFESGTTIPNMNVYFSDKSKEKKEGKNAIARFNASYCRYFVTCAAAAQIKGDGKSKDLYLSIAKQFNEAAE